MPGALGISYIARAFLLQCCPLLCIALFGNKRSVLMHTYWQALVRSNLQTGVITCLHTMHSLTNQLINLNLLSINRCVFRFPSTNIRLEFQSLIEDKLLRGDFGEIDKKDEIGNSTNGRFGVHNLLTPLNVNIPDTMNTASNSDFLSPIPSPTGTIRYVKSFLKL